MDINSIDFKARLPLLLRTISNAHFVAIDLELSGIPSHQQNNKPRSVGDVSGGKKTLQERYEETKRAAERYQVLQLGLTCVDEDKQRGVYITRPYNFFLNPVPDERLNIERIFSYQSGAVQFLLGHKFRMEAPFLEGVSYYSRQEEAESRRIALERQDKAAVADIQIRSDDTEALDFLQRVRTEIDTWKHRPTPQPDYLNIAPIGHDQPGSQHFNDRGLNNYQKRLVHQLVRAEHPDLVTISRPGFIQIVAFDQEREDLVKKGRNTYFEEKLARQIGLRWVVEAMVGGDLSAIDPKTIDQSVEDRLEEITHQLDEIRSRLKGKKVILVGHNLFLDLINFHTCFFGQLPESVKDFQKIMHQLFPIIIDTKYLATHNVVNPALSKSSLEDLDHELSRLPVPLIETHPDHGKYTNETPAHEAGFDSFLTSKVLIRLSAKLEAAGRYVDENSLPRSEDEAYHTAPEEGGITLSAVTISAHPLSLQKATGSEDDEVESSDSSTQGVSLTAATTEVASTSPVVPKKPKRKQKKLSPTAFSHPTMFDLLGDIPSDEEPMNLRLRAAATNDSDSRSALKKRGKISALEPWPEPVVKFTMMPDFESHFWTVYGNKLRVNGTVEGVCEFL